MEIYVLIQYDLESHIDILCVSEDIGEISSYIINNKIEHDPTISLDVWEHGKRSYSIEEAHHILEHNKLVLLKNN